MSYHLLSRFRTASPPAAVNLFMTAPETFLIISSASLYSSAVMTSLYLGDPTLAMSTLAPSAASIPASRASRMRSTPSGAMVVSSRIPSICT